MTRIDFYTHAVDPLEIACALSAKAVKQGLRVLVFTDGPEATKVLDKRMWTRPALYFVPHCQAHDELAARTPVIIDHVGEAIQHHQLLINLQAAWPPFFSRFERLAEIVGTAEPDIQLGREKYKFYRDRGYEIHTHNLSERAKET